MTTEPTSIRVECRTCGAIQELTAEGVSEDQEVTCSNCGLSLGSWRDLKTEGRVGSTKH